MIQVRRSVYEDNMDRMINGFYSSGKFVIRLLSRLSERRVVVVVAVPKEKSLVKILYDTLEYSVYAWTYPFANNNNNVELI